MQDIKKKYQKDIDNVQNMLRMNLESAGSLVTSLESDTIRARSLVQGLEYQLQGCQHSIKFIRFMHLCIYQSFGSVKLYQADPPLKMREFKMLHL